MPDPDGALAEVYVQPGDSHFAEEPVVIRTLLGSCVGVTFWHQRLGVAALCHAMLPVFPKGATREASNVANGRRYVDFTIRNLAQQFDARGANRSDVQVKVFGGADVLTAIRSSPRPTVGRLNCESALRVLRDEGFVVSASSLGGNTGLTIHFNTLTGEVRLRRLT
jgi:chemotaxis protein CheD